MWKETHKCYNWKKKKIHETNVYVFLSLNTEKERKKEGKIQCGENFVTFFFRICHSQAEQNFRWYGFFSVVSVRILLSQHVVSNDKLKDKLVYIQYGHFFLKSLLIIKCCFILLKWIYMMHSLHLLFSVKNISRAVCRSHFTWCISVSFWLNDLAQKTENSMCIELWAIIHRVCLNVQRCILFLFFLHRRFTSKL